MTDDDFWARLNAQWENDEVEAVNRWQKNRLLPAYTCAGTDSHPHTRMIATGAAEGLVCPHSGCPTPLPIDVAQAVLHRNGSVLDDFAGGWESFNSEVVWRGSAVPLDTLVVDVLLDPRLYRMKLPGLTLAAHGVDDRQSTRLGVLYAPDLVNWVLKTLPEAAFTAAGHDEWARQFRDLPVVTDRKVRQKSTLAAHAATAKQIHSVLVDGAPTRSQRDEDALFEALRVEQRFEAFEASFAADIGYGLAWYRYEGTPGCWADRAVAMVIARSDPATRTAIYQAMTASLTELLASSSLPADAYDPFDHYQRRYSVLRTKVEL